MLDIHKQAKQMASEVREHLIKDLIPFWGKLKDEKYGGYYGYMGYELNVNTEAEKGCILNSRILWFFSNAYRVLQEKEVLQCAEHAYEFFKNYCWDKVQGGVFWSLNYDGTKKDTTKHTYNQAFALYALSSYYEVTKNEEVLHFAQQIFQIIENKCRDFQGYLEAFTIDFAPESNEKLSENGVMAERTMNTLLHVLEAYTEYYRVTKEPSVGSKIREILDAIKEKVYNKELHRQEVFFDKEWNSLIDLHSFGHDIETAWLVDRSLEVLDDPIYRETIRPITSQLASTIYEVAYQSSSIVNEAENGVVDETRVWWVQAEGVVGFLNAWEKDSNIQYLKASVDIWNYIKQYLMDLRAGSEWFWAVDCYGKPLEKPIVEPWKCPYHNGRMCIEVIRRLEHL